jgi:hypothetical protein
VLKKKIWANFQRIVELFTKKIVKPLKNMVLGSGIRDPGSGKNLFRIPDPGVKQHPIPDPDPQHWRKKTAKNNFFFLQQIHVYIYSIAHTYKAVKNFYTSANPLRKASCCMFAVDCDTLLVLHAKQSVCVMTLNFCPLYPGLPLFQMPPAVGAYRSTKKDIKKTPTSASCG